MHFVIDLILIAIIALIALISAKQGFVKAVIEVVGFVAAVVLAFSVSTPMAEYTYTNMIEPSIVNSVSESIEETTNNTTDVIWEKLPKLITDNASNFGISKDGLEETISQGTKDDTKAVITDISKKVVSPIVVGLLETVYAVILIVILLFIVKIIAKLLNKVFSFSVIGKLNSTLGGILGVVKGLAIVLIVCEAILLIISFTENGIWIFNNENIEKTIFFKFLTNIF